MDGLVRVILVYKSGLGIFASPLGAKLAICTNLAHKKALTTLSTLVKSARLGVLWVRVS